MKKRLLVLAEKFKAISVSANKSNNYGAPEGGEFELPSNHKAAMVLKNGGFSCANCEYVNVKDHECNNEYYIKWNAGSKKLPDGDLNLICSDWFQPKD